VLVLVSAQERLLQTLEALLSKYDAAREDKLRLYWARGAVEEVSFLPFHPPFFKKKNRKPLFVYFSFFPPFFPP